MRLISKEDLGLGGKVKFAGGSFDSVLRLVLRLFQCFEYAFVVYIFIFSFFFILFRLIVFMSY